MGKGRNALYKMLPQSNDTQFKISLRQNMNTFYFFFNRMCRIYMNLTVLEGVPDSVDIPTLKWGLITNGNVCYFNDIVMGDLCLMGAPSGMVDVYNYPNAYYIHTASGYNRHLRVSRFDPKQDGVVIYSNYMRTAPLIDLQEYALRLTDCLRSADVNIKNQKTMNIIRCKESTRLTFVNIMKNYDGNVPHMLADENIMREDEDFKVYRLDTPFVADKIWTYITNIWNDFLTYCGIENATNQKKERLVSDEVNANYGDVEMERNNIVGVQQYYFDQVNKLFGTNIKVRFNSSLDTSLNIPFQRGDVDYGKEFYSEQARDSFERDSNSNVTD